MLSLNDDILDATFLTITEKNFKKMLDRSVKIAILGTKLEYGGKHCDILLSVIERYVDHAELVVALDKDDLPGLKLHRFDLVFVRAKSAQNWVPEYLEAENIPYTGSDSKTMLYDYRKSEAKKKVREAGIPTADFFIAEPGAYGSETELPVPLPLFIKPQGFGDARGIDNDSIATDFEIYKRKVAQIHNELKAEALAETFLNGDEYTVAILEDPESSDLHVYPAKITLNESVAGNILDEEIKDKRLLFKIHQFDDVQTNAQLADLATKAFRALGARSYARMDFRADSEGNLYFLEVNLRPGMARIGFLPTAIIDTGQLTYDEIVLRIAESSLNR